MNSATNNIQADTNTIIEATKQESARVQSRIVQHPEKLKQAIADMTVSVSNEKNAVSQLEKKAREIQSKIEMMGVVESDVTSCVSAIGECNSEIKKYEEAMKKVQNDKENIDRKQVESKEHNLKEQVWIDLRLILALSFHLLTDITLSPLANASSSQYRSRKDYPSPTPSSHQT